MKDINFCPISKKAGSNKKPKPGSKPLSLKLCVVLEIKNIPIIIIKTAMNNWERKLLTRSSAYILIKFLFDEFWLERDKVVKNMFYIYSCAEIIGTWYIF